MIPAGVIRPMRRAPPSAASATGRPAGPNAALAGGLHPADAARAREEPAMATTRSGTTHLYAGVARYRGTGGVTGPDDTLTGLFRLTLGEDRWERLAGGLPADCEVQCVTVDPNDHATVYAGTHDGLWRSTDRGGSWRRIGPSPEPVQVWAVTVHPTRPRTLFAGTSPIGIWRSDDAGATWRHAPSSARPDRMEMGRFVNRVMRIAVDPTHPDEIYAACEVNGVIRSLDGGETWTDCSADLVALSNDPHLRSAILTTSPAEGMLDAHALCVSAAEPRAVLLAVRMGLFRSADRAQSWRDMEIGRFSPITYGRDIRVSPHDPRTLYACLSTAANGATGSILRSHDLGRSWERIDHGNEVESTMMAVAPHPRDAAMVFGAARKGQVFGTIDCGETWHERRLPEKAGMIYALAVG